MGNQSLDLITFLETIKSRIFDFQTNQMVLSIKKMGDFCLTPEYPDLAIEPTDWSMMNIEQQKVLVKKVIALDALPDISEHKENCINLSAGYGDMQEDLGLVSYIIKQLWSEASFILTICSVSSLMGGNYCVTERNVAYTVSKSVNGIYTCMCEHFIDTAGLFPHLFVVADREECLLEVLNKYCKSDRKVGKMINANKPGKNKAKNSKPRKGANNIKTEPLIKIFQLNNSQAEFADPDIDVAKPVAYTNFLLVLLLIPNTKKY